MIYFNFISLLMFIFLCWLQSRILMVNKIPEIFWSWEIICKRQLSVFFQTASHKAEFGHFWTHMGKHPQPQHYFSAACENSDFVYALLSNQLKLHTWNFNFRQLEQLEKGRILKWHRENGSDAMMFFSENPDTPTSWHENHFT